MESKKSPAHNRLRISAAREIDFRHRCGNAHPRTSPRTRPLEQRRGTDPWRIRTLIRVALSIAGMNNGTNGNDALRVLAIHIAPGSRSSAVGHAKGQTGWSD